MQNKLPADPSALILGIVGLVIGIAGCCCYGFTAIIPLGLSIAGLVMANKSMKLYRLNPEEFSESSRSNVSIARVLNIISIILNGLFLLIVIGALAFLGVAGMTGAFDDLTNDAYSTDNNWEYEDDFSDDMFMEEEVDSISTDSIFLNEVFPERDSID
ncbi:CCC motif membrane protein [uncultured Dokdonia sp.]|uniref:CCC motif membrane protein n=1 Tax=Dokdonia sp. R78006 TaxID=3093866 RepID=UPI00260575BF|nr:CCC motif membrane protein [uncultured Dokdonia sp.]|tara:strand:+ start:229136 stop:229609 length:474 start_codon:yes stop_codon:yes gene_type:complete